MNVPTEPSLTLGPRIASILREILRPGRRSECDYFHGRRRTVVNRMPVSAALRIVPGVNLCPPHCFMNLPSLVNFTTRACRFPMLWPPENEDVDVGPRHRPRRQLAERHQHLSLRTKLKNLMTLGFGSRLERISKWARCCLCRCSAAPFRHPGCSFRRHRYPPRWSTPWFGRREASSSARWRGRDWLWH